MLFSDQTCLHFTTAGGPLATAAILPLLFRRRGSSRCLTQALQEKPRDASPGPSCSAWPASLVAERRRPSRCRGGLSTARCCCSPPHPCRPPPPGHSSRVAGGCYPRCHSPASAAAAGAAPPAPPRSERQRGVIVMDARSHSSTRISRKLLPCSRYTAALLPAAAAAARPPPAVVMVGWCRLVVARARHPVGCPCVACCGAAGSAWPAPCGRG